MLRFDNSGMTLEDAFKLSNEDVEKTEGFLHFYNNCRNVSKAVERVWVDETTNDNTKAFALFTIGRQYEFNRSQHRGGGEK